MIWRFVTSNRDVKIENVLKYNQPRGNYLCKTTIKTLEQQLIYSTVDIYLFKVNSRNTGTMFEVCSKLKIKTPERQRLSGVFIFEFENISHVF